MALLASETMEKPYFRDAVNKLALVIHQVREEAFVEAEHDRRIAAHVIALREQFTIENPSMPGNEIADLAEAALLQALKIAETFPSECGKH